MFNLSFKNSSKRRKGFYLDIFAVKYEVFGVDLLGLCVDTLPN